MLRVMIVDDELPARRGLRRLLATHGDVVVAAEAGSLHEARPALAEMRPDLVFLDVELGDGKGFQAIAGLEPRPDVIFVTAYSRYAVDAFDVAAADFLVKPVEPERLAIALQRVRKRRSLLPARETRLRISLPGQQLLLPRDSLLFLEAEGDFTRMAVSGDRDRLVCRLLGEFEADLPDPPFRRLGRSVIVNLEQVQVVQSLDGGQARLLVGPERRALDLGRAATRRLRETSRPAA